MRLWHDLLAKFNKRWPNDLSPSHPTYIPHALKKTPDTILSQVSICYISQEFITSGFLILLFYYLQLDLSGMVLSHHSSLYSTDIFPWQQQPNLKIPIFDSHTHYLNLCMWPSLHWHHGQGTRSELHSSSLTFCSQPQWKEGSIVTHSMLSLPVTTILFAMYQELNKIKTL